MHLRLGTRGSRLALTQTNQTAEALRLVHPGLEVEVVVIQTTGDKIQDSPLSAIGGKGVFTKEIEEALLEGRIDVAVHSLKDVPTRQPAGLAIGAVTARLDPHDLLLAREPVDITTMPAGARLGTSSLRRRAQTARTNPSIQIDDLRGNVPTRIQKMINGQYDAVILAAAGVERLGERAPFMAPIPFDIMLPAPGQGAVGLQIREEDTTARRLLAAVHDEDSARCCAAERTLLEALGGGCQLPLGTIAKYEDGRIHLRGRVISLDGLRCAEGEAAGGDPISVGRELAEKILSEGGREILDSLELDGGGGFEQAVLQAAEMDKRPLGGKVVLVTRDEDADGPLSMALRELGGAPLCLPLVRHAPAEDPAPLKKALADAGNYDWLILTSRRAVDAVVAQLGAERPRARVACVGLSTADAARAAGFEPEIAPREGTAVALADQLIEAGVRGARMLYPRSELARPALKEALKSAGAIVDDPIAYRTLRLRATGALETALRGRRPDAALFCSSSAVEALDEKVAPLFDGMVVGSIGPPTTESLQRLGINVSFESTERSFPGLAMDLAGYFAKR